MQSSEWSRRKFIATVSAAGVALMFPPEFSWATEVDPKVAAIVAKTIGIDTHSHIDVPFATAEVPGPKIDLSGDLNQSGLAAICMTFAVDRPELRNPGEAYDRFINALTSVDQQLANNNMKRALNFADLKAAHKSKKPIAIQSVEGGHFLEGKIERLAIAYSRGLRHLGLLHDNDASVPLGDVFTNKPQWGGLTAFGTEVIKECNKQGILVDLSHGSDEMVNAALKIATKPVLISHTGLNTQLGSNERMATMMKPRLISKEQAKIVADAGGVIGVWTHLADTSLEYAQNVRALADVVGIDHVCIGTDTKLTPSYRPGGGGNALNNGGRSGGGQNAERIGERTNKAWKDQTAGFYYTVVDALLKTGFNEDEISKIGGGNFCRIFDAATAGH